MYQMKFFRSHIFGTRPLKEMKSTVLASPSSIIVASFAEGDEELVVLVVLVDSLAFFASLAFWRLAHSSCVEASWNLQALHFEHHV